MFRVGVGVDSVVVLVTAASYVLFGVNRRNDSKGLQPSPYSLYFRMWLRF